MKILADSVFDAGFSDFRLRAVSWAENGKDVFFRLDPRSTGQQIEVCFVWVYDLRVLLEYGEYVGSPLIHETSFVQMSDGGMRVHFGFSPCPKGAIDFKCTRAEAREVEEGSRVEVRGSSSPKCAT
jgi:hypothetical protein